MTPKKGGEKIANLRRQGDRTNRPERCRFLGNEPWRPQILPMTISDLQSLLDRTMAGDRPHAEKITIAAAVLSEVGTIDEPMLRERVRAEQAEDALDVLWAMARSGALVGEADLRNALDHLHGRKEGHR